MYEKIYQQVARIPAGYVASYGQVAQAAGLYRGARLVGWALRQLPQDTPVPWQRVVNRNGVISIINPRISKNQQREALEAEGVEVVEADGIVRVIHPRWWSFD
ncbi:MGMT family protein [Patescibacteria group bacterium]|nr:MGMT family protein [Patescibacteria group bacterium]